jgi:hypothetical protein
VDLRNSFDLGEQWTASSSWWDGLLKRIESR